MQDRYAGDIGDYGKFAMFRAMEAQGLKLGINWYRTETAAFEIHDDGKYRIPEKFETCDPQLSAALNAIFDSVDNRSVQKLERANLLKCEHYISELVPRNIGERLGWHRRALTYFNDCDLVFLDPDNGLNVKSVKQGSQKSVKYVWLDEITDYISNRKSVIFYNHRPRKKAAAYFSEYSARLAPIGRPVYALTFPRRSIRDYFIIPTSSAHKAKILEALHSLKDGPFGKTGFCCLHPIPVCAVDDLP